MVPEREKEKLKLEASGSEVSPPAKASSDSVAFQRADLINPLEQPNLGSDYVYRGKPVSPGEFFSFQSRAALVFLVVLLLLAGGAYLSSLLDARDSALIAAVVFIVFAAFPGPLKVASRLTDSQRRPNLFGVITFVFIGYLLIAMTIWLVARSILPGDVPVGSISIVALASLILFLVKTVRALPIRLD